MGNWLSSDKTRRAEPPPEGVTVISDTLYELSDPVDNPEMDIVFFHGLQLGDYAQAYWTTWCRDEKDLKTLWPRTLLARDIPKARVLSVCLDTCALKSATGGHLDMYLLGENLVQILLSIGKVGSGNRPVVLVGHSLGGLVIKKFLLMADTKRHRCQGSSRSAMDAFLDKNVAGVFYYATPHEGSTWATWASKLPAAGPLLEFLKKLGTDAGRLNSSFENWRKNTKRKISTYSIAEGKPTPLLGINAKLVEEAAARRDTEEFFTAQDKDHITVCKPMSSTDETYELLREFIKSIALERNHELTEAPEALKASNLV